MNDKWHGKVVLVTGGSAGLGKEIARSFARRGARVVVAARGQTSLATAQQELAQQGLDVNTIAADVTVPQQVEQMMAEVVQLHGQLDVLVNNAGRSSRGEALTTSVEEYRQLLELNFLAVVQCTQAAVPYLTQTRGHLVQIGSLSAKVASPYLGAYPASKFPLAAFSQQLRLELEPQGVHVLLVCPGPIRRPDAGSRYDQQTSGLPQQARKPGGGVKLKGIDPQVLADKIIAACQRRRAELIVPGRAKLLFALAQLWPRLGDRIIRKATGS